MHESESHHECLYDDVSNWQGCLRKSRSADIDMAWVAGLVLLDRRSQWVLHARQRPEYAVGLGGGPIESILHNHPDAGVEFWNSTYAQASVLHCAKVAQESDSYGAPVLLGEYDVFCMHGL